MAQRVRGAVDKLFSSRQWRQRSSIIVRGTSQTPEDGRRTAEGLAVKTKTLGVTEEKIRPKKLSWWLSHEPWHPEPTHAQTRTDVHGCCLKGQQEEVIKARTGALQGSWDSLGASLMSAMIPARSSHPCLTASLKMGRGPRWSSRETAARWNTLSCVPGRDPTAIISYEHPPLTGHRGRFHIKHNVCSRVVFWDSHLGPDGKSTRISFSSLEVSSAHSTLTSRHKLSLIATFSPL